MPRDNDSNEGWRCSVCRAFYDYAKSSRCPYCELDELAELREQSTREHEAWEAVRSGEVVLCRAIDGRFLASSPSKRSFRDHPVDAVLAVKVAEMELEKRRKDCLCD